VIYSKSGDIPTHQYCYVEQRYITNGELNGTEPCVWFGIVAYTAEKGCDGYVAWQDERIWMNYRKPVELHDYAYIGDGRRSRERIRRRQKNWREQLLKMPQQERLAMLEVLNNSLKGD